MFSKVLVVLLTLLMFMNVPVYTAHAEETYTLRPGKVYVVRLYTNYDYADLVFSDNVLCRYGSTDTGYDGLSTYYDYVTRYYHDKLNYYDRVYVYNVSGSDVIMTLDNGEIRNISERQSPFYAVMYDGTETEFEMEYIGNNAIYYKKFYFDNDAGLLRFDKTYFVMDPGAVREFDGKGVLIIRKAYYDQDLELEDVLRMNGVYEVGDHFRYDFFYRAPWILGMDLMGIMEVFWEQLSMLLPVGLIVLSVPLLIYLTRYTVRLFL